MSRKLMLLMLLALLVGTLNLASRVEKAKASGIIYIRADGSVEPIGVSILDSDNMTYTFTGDIDSSVIIQRDNVVIDGHSHNLRGTGDYGTNGLTLNGRNNVTIKNMGVSLFDSGFNVSSSSRIVIIGNSVAQNLHEGIRIDYSSNNITLAGNNISGGGSTGILVSSDNNAIVENNITGAQYGVLLSSSHNLISSNHITGNSFGIWSQFSTYNTVCQNIIANNFQGIDFIDLSDSNNIVGNNITGNSYIGIRLEDSSNTTINRNEITHNEYGVYLKNSSQNSIYLNNFVNNTNQAYYYTWPSFPSPTINLWDDGSKGNYWSDYVEKYPNATEIDSSGVWNTPYVVDENNTDNNPLTQEAVTIPEFPSFLILPLFMMATLLAVIIYKRKHVKIPGTS